MQGLTARPGLEEHRISDGTEQRNEHGQTGLWCGVIVGGLSRRPLLRRLAGPVDNRPERRTVGLEHMVAILSGQGLAAVSALCRQDHAGRRHRLWPAAAGVGHRADPALQWQVRITARRSQFRQSDRSEKSRPAQANPAKHPHRQVQRPSVVAEWRAAPDRHLSDALGQDDQHCHTGVADLRTVHGRVRPKRRAAQAHQRPAPGDGAARLRVGALRRRWPNPSLQPFHLTGGLGPRHAHRRNPDHRCDPVSG
jgi:hypothetical protein